MNIFERAAEIIADKLLVHERVAKDEKGLRLAICEGCEYLDRNSRRCKVCKCFVDAKTSAKTNTNPLKGRNEITHCPMGLWGDIDTANYYREIDGVLPIS